MADHLTNQRLSKKFFDDFHKKKIIIKGADDQAHKIMQIKNVFVA